MSDESWVKAAMTDDSVVVELLMHLHHAAAAPAKRECSPAFPPLEWSVRQRRSKQMLEPAKKPTPRASPTTPLSWSGGTSVSGGGGCAAGGGFEESSRKPTKRPESTRSKVTATCGTTTNKRSRKKKTLTELKEEESLLIKERRHLKRELATLRVTVEKQRATNESLKRLKLDIVSQPAAERVAMSVGTRQNLATCDPIPLVLQPDVRIADHDVTQPLSPNAPSKLQQQQVINGENDFLVPDLNLPIDDSNSLVSDRIS